MIKLENYEVLGWEHAIRGMRNPMNSWEKSDSIDCIGQPSCEGCPKHTEDPWGCVDSGTYYFIVGPNDRKLMMQLRNAGTDHRKFMRMITVYVDITAPLYWWKEFDTYKVGTVANSCSTMHKIHDKPFTRSDFSWDQLIGAEEDPVLYIPGDEGMDPWRPREVLDLIGCMLNECRVRYVELDNKIKNKDYASFEEGKALIEERKKWWWQMIQLLPTSYNQKRTIMLNYEVLANMYKSRKTHKLDEWREFCKWIESLPYSEIITGVSRDVDEGDSDGKDAT